MGELGKTDERTIEMFDWDAFVAKTEELVERGFYDNVGCRLPDYEEEDEEYEEETY